MFLMNISSDGLFYKCGQCFSLYFCLTFHFSFFDVGRYLFIEREILNNKDLISIKKDVNQI